MESRVFRVFESALGNSKRVIVAYSGGKDSTALSLLLYDWVASKGVRDIEIVLANSDTLSEIPAMRDWTMEFMRWYTRRLGGMGIRASYTVYVPEPTDTFYWRVLVRGYPAPTFSFRWCVKLLKRKPAKRLAGAEDSILLLGHRDDESSARARALRRRLALCPLSAGRCASYYLQTEGRAKKLYPIRDLSEEDIWRYLRSKRSEIALEELFELYGHGAVKARYGCWHCTLVKLQIGHYLLGKGYMYLEALRLIYKWLSDVPELRARKEKGYSRLGHLKPIARAVLLHAFEVAEKLSGLRFYGLDDAKVGGYSLREIFYTLEEGEADRVVHAFERKAEAESHGRLSSVAELRHPRDKKEILKTIEIMMARAKVFAKLPQNGSDEYLTGVLSELERSFR